MATVWKNMALYCEVKDRHTKRGEVAKNRGQKKGVSTNACQVFAHLSFFAPHNITFCDIPPKLIYQSV